jgi:hypothetical protein
VLVLVLVLVLVVVLVIVLVIVLMVASLIPNIYLLPARTCTPVGGADESAVLVPLLRRS